MAISDMQNDEVGAIAGGRMMGAIDTPDWQL
jgi:hypothetical protein